MADIESAFGVATLGNLRYQDRTQVWALELGQFMTNYELFSSINPGPVALAIRQEAITAVKQLLDENRLPFNIDDSENVRDLDVSTILRLVGDIHGSTHCALILIGNSSCALRHIPNLESQHPRVRPIIEQYARDRLREIQIRCPDLAVVVDDLFAILLRRPQDDLTTSGIRRLFLELSKPLSILVISADPRNAHRLRLGEERRELEDALRATRFRDCFNIHDRPSCRVRDITRALDDHNPTILHFSGHGSARGICMEDSAGRVQVVDETALAGLFQHQQGLRLVIINACYAYDQAQCIADSIGYVIAMNGAIQDADAISFTREFYNALGSGRTVEKSFERAEAGVRLETTRLQPRLLKRKSYTGLAA